MHFPTAFLTPEKKVQWEFLSVVHCICTYLGSKINMNTGLWSEYNVFLHQFWHKGYSLSSYSYSWHFLICMYSMSQKKVSNLVPFRSMNRSFLFSFVSITLGSTPKCSLACSCSCVYFSTSSCSDYVWNEQSKNLPLHLYGSTIVESGLGQWMLHVQQNDRMKLTETEPNWKRRLL